MHFVKCYSIEDSHPFQLTLTDENNAIDLETITDCHLSIVFNLECFEYAISVSCMSLFYIYIHVLEACKSFVYLFGCYSLDSNTKQIILKLRLTVKDIELEIWMVAGFIFRLKVWQKVEELFPAETERVSHFLFFRPRPPPGPVNLPKVEWMQRSLSFKILPGFSLLPSYSTTLWNVIAAVVPRQNTNGSEMNVIRWRRSFCLFWSLVQKLNLRK